MRVIRVGCQVTLGGRAIRCTALLQGTIRTCARMWQQWYQPACSLLSGIAQGVAHVDSEAYNGAFNTYERLFGALEAAYYQAKWGMDLDDALLFDALSGLAEVGSNPEDDQIAVIVVIIVLG